VTGLSREEQAAFFAARSEAVVSDAALAAFRDEWEPKLAAHGLGLDGSPLPTEEPDDIWFGDVPKDADGPPPDWESLGVIAPDVLPAGVPEVDVMDFIATGGDEDDEEWLVDGLVPLHGLTILGGNPKSGKTLFALDLCISVATCGAFLGRDTSPAAFLFVTEEGTPGEMRKRFRRLIASRGVPSLPGRVIHRRGIRFDDPRSWQSVREAIGRLDQPTLLVLDPLRDLLVGDENDSNTIATVARAIHAILRDYEQVTVVLLHHLSKRGDGDGGQRLRGSTALWGTADNTLILKADPIPDGAGESGEVELRGSVSVEPRNAQRGRFLWRWDPTTGQFIETAAEARTVADRARVFLTEHGPSTTTAIAAALATTPDVVRHSLARDERFRSRPGEGPNGPSVWQLAE
jgi:hypothetical protein